MARSRIQQTSSGKSAAWGSNGGVLDGPSTEGSEAPESIRGSMTGRGGSGRATSGELWGAGRGVSHGHSLSMAFIAS